MRQIDDYEATLREIARIGYGVELSDTDEQRAEYWSKLALRYRALAAAALKRWAPS